MLRTLLESNAPRQRRRGSTAASIAIHTVVIAAAVVATASAKTEPRRPPERGENPPIYVPVTGPEPRVAKGRDDVRRANFPEGPMLEKRLPALAFTPPPSTVLRSDVDPTALLGGERWVIDAEPFGGERQELDSGARGEPLTIDRVDRVAALLAAPRPRYPEQLRAAGVTGRVVVRFVVDTSGRVEPASIVVREAGHELFAQAVRAVLPLFRFAPAEVAGQRVRMLVDLPFEFRLNE